MPLVGDINDCRTDLWNTLQMDRGNSILIYQTKYSSYDISHVEMYRGMNDDAFFAEYSRRFGDTDREITVQRYSSSYAGKYRKEHGRSKSHAIRVFDYGAITNACVKCRVVKKSYFPCKLR